MPTAAPAAPAAAAAAAAAPETCRPGNPARRRFTQAAAAVAAALAVPAARALPAAPDGAEALHVLNRISLGPAPGDLARVMQQGIDGYIDEQLRPRQLALPDALARRLAALPTLSATQGELAARYRDALQAARDDSDAGRARRRELLQRVAFEAGDARLSAALQSPRQLEEVLVDFWFNHFNVFIGKGLTRVLVANYEREAIRPHVLGRFRDLLGATARHPAMLFYLDNWLSAAPDPARSTPPGRGTRRAGLNENYARELMELHTLGVDGGYTQHDVTALARIFTGWTLRPRAAAGSATLFAFDARRHDPGTKQWRGHSVAPRGQAEGDWALDLLAGHPATARHVSRKLAQYFVADEPPPALVDRLAARFLQTQGDLAAVTRLLLTSPEFRAPQHRGAKFKTPYRYLVSALRAADLPATNVRPLLAALAQLGMPLYGCATPDGYKNTEAAWLSPDAMTRRLNFATALASGRLPLARPADADTDDPPGAGRPQGAAMRRADTTRPGGAGNALRFDPAWASAPLQSPALLATLGPAISARTREVVAQSDPALRAALVLGSPDFMRH
jgi:uncharacterized protein (DUF1800 family)